MLWSLPIVRRNKKTLCRKDYQKVHTLPIQITYRKAKNRDQITQEILRTWRTIKHAYCAIHRLILNPRLYLPFTLTLCKSNTKLTH